MYGRKKASKKVGTKKVTKKVGTKKATSKVAKKGYAKKVRKSDQRDQALSREYGVMSPGTMGMSERQRNKTYQRKVENKYQRLRKRSEKIKALRGDPEAKAALERMKKIKKKTK